MRGLPCRDRTPDCRRRCGSAACASPAGAVTRAGVTTTLRPGERLEVDGVRVVALPGPDAPGAPPTLVAGTPAGTLLWAQGPGPLADAALDALTGAGLAGAALDLRGAAGRPDPLVLAHGMARLRAAGALAPHTPVVALGIGHELHPGLLVQRLARWGARVAADGEPLLGDDPAEARPDGPLRTLVLGPASSGKSALAEDLLAAEPAVLYAATGPAPSADDPTWSDRVRAHRGRRPAWWGTDETGDVARLLAAPGPPLLVDALGTWVAAVMDAAGAWDDAPGWQGRVEGEVDAVVAAWRQARRRVVAVGEEVGWGVVPAAAGVSAFRDVLGGLARRLAAESERVLLVVAGRVLELGPGAPR